MPSSPSTPDACQKELWRGHKPCTSDEHPIGSICVSLDVDDSAVSGRRNFMSRRRLARHFHRGGHHHRLIGKMHRDFFCACPVGEIASTRSWNINGHIHEVRMCRSTSAARTYSSKASKGSPKRLHSPAVERSGVPTPSPTSAPTPSPTVAPTPITLAPTPISEAAYKRLQRAIHPMSLEVNEKSRNIPSLSNTDRKLVRDWT